MSKDLVSVIIPTKNSQKYLEAVLRSVKRQSYKNIEIIIVDNNSTDGTKEIAKSFCAKVFNKGPERSVQKNYGVKFSDGKYILLLDSDCELEADVISECVRLCESGLDGVMIPMRHKGDGFWTRAKNLERMTYDGDDDLESPWFIRRIAFRKISGFNTDLIAAEDWDLAYRLRGAGFSLGRNKSVMYHNLGVYRLPQAFISKFYYGKNLVKYLSQKRRNTIKQIPFFRRAYLRNWKLLVTHPFLTFGFMFLKIVESFAVLLGLIYEKYFKKDSK